MDAQELRDEIELRDRVAEIKLGRGHEVEHEKHGDIVVPLDALTTVAFCDPASGKKKQQLKRVAARSAIVVVSYDYLMRFYLRFSWAARCSTTKLIERILEVNETYRPRRFGIESNAQQSLFAGATQQIARDMKKYLPLVWWEPSTKVTKEFRIRAALQPVVAEGRLLIGPNNTEFLSEFRTFPTGATKDLIDALASAIEMSPRKADAAQENDELEALKSYYRYAGLPASYLESLAKEAA